MSRRPRLWRRLASGTVAALCVGPLVLTTGVGAVHAAPTVIEPGNTGAFRAWGMGGSTVTDLGEQEVVQIDSTDNGHLARFADGSTRGFGSAHVPAGTFGDKRVTQLVGGYGWAMGLTADGEVRQWGTNTWGVLDTNPDIPGKVVKLIGAGNFYALFQTTDGRVYQQGRLHETMTSTVPTSLQGQDIVQFDGERNYAMALTRSGRVTTWGTSTPTVTAEINAHKIVEVAASTGTALALTDQGRILAFGNNPYGVGSIPAALANERVVSIDAGVVHAAALTASGKVFAWGSNSQGQTQVPPEVSSARVTAVSAGGWQTAVMYQPRITSTPPTISGNPGVGDTLTATAGTSTPASSDVSWQWQSDGTDLAGATDPTLTLTPALAGTRISVTSTHRLPRHVAGVSTSSPTDPVLAPFDSTDLTVTGTPRVGEPLTATLTTSPVSTRTDWTWTADGEVVAQGPDYTPGPGEVGVALEVAARPHADGYSSAALTRTLAPVEPAVQPTATVTVTGGTRAGERVRAAVELPAGTTADLWWSVGDERIAEGSELLLPVARVGEDLTAHATLRRAGHHDRTESAASFRVLPALLGEVSVNIEGEPRVDVPLTARVDVEAVDTAPAPTTAVTWWRGEVQVATGATYTPVAADSSHVLEVRTTTSAPGHEPRNGTASSTVVRPGAFESASAQVQGAARVGERLTATATSSPEADRVDWTWHLPDGSALGTGPTLRVPGVAAGSAVTVRGTLRALGRHPVEVETTTSVVAPGAFTDLGSRVSGSGRVGEPLSVRVTGDAIEATHTWWVNGGQVATGARWTPMPEHLGARVEVRSTLAAPGWTSLTLPAVVAAGRVREGQFVGTSLALTGTARDGERLGIDVSATPAPERVEVVWLRGATTVGTSERHELTRADVGRSLVARVKLHRAGYAPLTLTGTTPTVAPGQAPTIRFASSARAIRLGATVPLAWTTQHADSVTGNWSPRPVGARGNVSVRPTLPNGVSRQTQSWVLKATNRHGTTTATVRVVVSLPRAAFRVQTRKARHGKATRVTVRGMAAGEKVTLKVGARTYRATASKRGVATVKVKVRNTAKRVKKVKVVVKGSLPDRKGRGVLKVGPRR